MPGLGWAAPNWKRQRSYTDGVHHRRLSQRETATVTLALSDRPPENVVDSKSAAASEWLSLIMCFFNKDMTMINLHHDELIGLGVTQGTPLGMPVSSFQDWVTGSGHGYTESGQQQHRNYSPY